MNLIPLLSQVGTVLSKMDLDITLLGEKRDVSKLFAFNDKPARLCMLGKGTSAIPWGIILDNTWLGSPRNVTQGPAPKVHIIMTTAAASWTNGTTDTKIPVTTISASFGNYALSSNCVVIQSAGKYRVYSRINQVNNNDTVFVGYNVNGGAAVYNGVGFVGSTNPTTGRVVNSNTYQATFAYGDTVCGYAKSSVSRPAYNGLLELEQLDSKQTTQFGGTCKDAD